MLGSRLARVVCSKLVTSANRVPYKVNHIMNSQLCASAQMNSWIIKIYLKVNWQYDADGYHHDNEQVEYHMTLESVEEQ